MFLFLYKTVARNIRDKYLHRYISYINVLSTSYPLPRRNQVLINFDEHNIGDVFTLFTSAVPQFSRYEGLKENCMLHVVLGVNLK